MNPLMTALSSGISAEKILEYLMRQSPGLKNKISTALSSGIPAKKILGYFSKERNLDKLRQSMKEAYPMDNNANPLVQAQNVRGRNLGTDLGSGLQRFTGNALGAAAAAGTSYALSRAAPAILSQLAGSQAGAGNIPPTPPPIAGPTINPQPAPSTGPAANTPQIPQNQPPITPPTQTQAQPPVSPTVAQPSQPAQPQTTTIKPADVLSKHNIKEKVDQILKAKNKPQSVGAYFEKFDKKSKKRIEKETGMSFEKVIEEYASEQAQVPEVAKEEIAEPEEEAKPIEKDSIVSTPHGVGEVKSIKEKNALVEVDGKLQKVPVEELEQSPISEKDLADLHDELLRGIEAETGEDVSRMVQWAGYNPETNTLQFLPHTGKMYKYANISPEDAALLRDVLSVRKTSGSNFIGAWKAGSKSPIGAALSKLIRKLQVERGGKGKEYEETHETLYSAYEPAIEFKKRKKKKK